MRKFTTLAVPGEETPHEDTPRELLDRTLGHLEVLQAGAEETAKRERCGRCGGISNPALLRESANVGRAIANVSAELRQRDKHEQELDANRSATEIDALVLEYLCEIPRERREALRRILDERARDAHLFSQ